MLVIDTQCIDYVKDPLCKWLI